MLTTFVLTISWKRKAPNDGEVSNVGCGRASSKAHAASQYPKCNRWMAVYFTAVLFPESVSGSHFNTCSSIHKALQIQGLSKSHLITFDMILKFSFYLNTAWLNNLKVSKIIYIYYFNLYTVKCLLLDMFKVTTLWWRHTSSHQLRFPNVWSNVM